MQSTELHADAGSPTIILQPVDGPVTDLASLRRTATGSRLLSRRGSRKQRHQRSTSALHIDMISTEEYESLPPSIQRKYFSPKERIQIVQQAATQSRRRQSIKGSWLAPPTPTSPVRPSTSTGRVTRSTTSLFSRSAVSLLQIDQSTMTEDQARLFITLPDKVRKQQFSKEEQLALMMRCKKVLEHVSPEMAADAYRRILNLSGEEREPSLTKSRPSTSSELAHNDGRSHFSFDTSSDVESEDADLEIFGKYLQPDDCATVVACTMDDLKNRASTPLSYPEPKDPVPTPKPKRKSLMRRHSLMPLPLPAPTLAPPVPALPSFDQVRHFALSAKQSRPSTEHEFNDVEQSTEKKFYQNLDARNQLRKAIASPEKFDEALAFGFSPSDERNDSTSTDSLFPLQQPALYHSEQEDGDAHSIETASPRTPTYHAEDQTAIKQHSFDSGISFPFSQVSRPKTSGSAVGSSKSREMTIHMTLTRQDLRSPSPEEQLYSTQRLQTTGVDIEKTDPLALEPLPVTEDSTGAHGAFAVSNNGFPRRVKSVWQFLRGQ